MDSLARTLQARYIFPDLARTIANSLPARSGRGELGRASSLESWADSLTAAMRAVSHDKHLHIWLQPDRDSLDERRRRQLERAEQALEGRRTNYGFQRVERLRGNVGYLDVRAFWDPAEAKARDAATTAMQFLANTDALIIDLRENHGGHPNMVAYLASYLLGEQPVHINSFVWREANRMRTVESWTRRRVPGRRYGTEKPLWVLTSGDTFSGGEEFAYDLQTQRRGTLVGEPTGGGANPGDPFPLGHGFMAFIPTGRAVNRSPEPTGRGWV
ncbi:MAG: S41 family peptidase [Gemmatimonadales bacterium]